MPGAKATDRRVRRTRQSIRAAVVDLCAERDFGSLTIEDILDRADIARATFYAHYRTKEDVLVDIAMDLAGDRAAWVAEFDSAGGEAFTGDPLRSIFEHAEKYAGAYRIILGGAGDGRALREFWERTSQEAQALFQARAEKSGVPQRVPVPLVARAWAGQLISTLGWWLREDTGLSAVEAARLLSELSVNGRRWAEGGGPSAAS